MRLENGCKSLFSLKRASEMEFVSIIGPSESEAEISGKKDTLRCIDFHNPFLTLVGCMEKEEFYGQIKTRDTLIQVVYRVPRKFLFFRWGTKAIRQKILSCNPYSQIVYDEYIELCN